MKIKLFHLFIAANPFAICVLIIVIAASGCVRRQPIDDSNAGAAAQIKTQAHAAVKAKILEEQTRLRFVVDAGLPDVVETIMLSPDEKMIVISSGRELSETAMRNESGGNAVIKLLDAASGRELRTILTDYDEIKLAGFLPDGKTIVGCGKKYDLSTAVREIAVKLWDATTGREIQTVLAEKGVIGKTALISEIALSPNGRIIASHGNLPVLEGSIDKTVKLWDVATGRQLRTLEGHQGDVLSFNFASDGQTLLTVANDNTMKLWELNTGRELWTSEFVNGLSQAVFSPDNKIIASGGFDRVELWDSASGRRLLTLSDVSNINKGVYASEAEKLSTKLVRFSPDGKKLISQQRNGTIKSWDTATGRESSMPDDHSAKIFTGQLSPDGKTIASRDDSGKIELIKRASGKTVNILENRGRTVLDVNFSPDGQTLASSDNEENVKLWHAARGGNPRTLPGKADSLNFSPDSTALAGIILTGNYRSRIRTFWNTATGDEIFYDKLPEWAEKFVKNPLRQPSGGLIYAVPFRNAVVLFDQTEQKILATINIFKNDEWVIYTPEGRFDASPGAEKYLYYQRGNEFFALETHRDQYFESNLLSKILNWNQEPMRDIKPLDRN